MSVGSVVRGSGVGVFLHSCSRFDVVGWGMLGSPTTLRERGSSSESLSVGSVNHPCRLAVFRFSWVLRPKMEQGFGLAELVLRLSGFQRKAKSVVRFVVFLTLNPIQVLVQNL